MSSHSRETYIIQQNVDSLFFKKNVDSPFLYAISTKSTSKRVFFRRIRYFITTENNFTYISKKNHEASKML